VFLGVLSLPGPVNSQEVPVILPSRFDDALPRDPLALKAATKEPSWRRRIAMSGSDSST
jgi:hypothetical protein